MVALKNTIEIFVTIRTIVLSLTSAEVLLALTLRIYFTLYIYRTLLIPAIYINLSLINL
jgi:hypothetical protein